MNTDIFYSSVFVGLLVLVSVFFNLSSNTQEQQFNKEQENLEKLMQMDANINLEVYLLHERVKKNYDNITTMLNKKYAYLENIKIFGMGTNISTLKQSVDKKAVLIEEFKSEDSVLHNSETYLPLAIDKLKNELDKDRPNNDISEILLQLKNEVLLFVYDDNESDSHNLENIIHDIDSRDRYKAIQEDELWDGVRRHGRSIIMHKTNVNGLLQKILADEYKLLLNDQHRLSIDSEETVKVRADFYKFCLFMTTLALLFYCVWFYVRINKYTKELNELNASLEDRIEERNKELSNYSNRMVALINTSPSIIYATEVTDTYKQVFVSENIFELLGYSAEDLLQDPGFWIKNIHPDDKKSVLEIMPNLFQHGAVIIDYRMRHKAGHYLYIQDSARLLLDENDKPKEVIGSWADITKLKNSESDLKQKTNSLEQAHQHLAGILETAVDAIISIDPDGQILSFNPAATTIFGYEAHEVIGENVKILMPEPYQSQHDGYLSNYHKTGVKKVMGIGREVIGKRKDGSEFPMELSISEVKTGNLQRFTGIVRDVSERKIFESQLKHEKEYSESLIQNQSNPTFVIDKNHIVLSWNKACEELTGIKSEDVIGTNNHWRGFYQEERPCLADTVIDIDSKKASDLYVNYTKSPLLADGIHAQNWCIVAKGEEKYLSIDAAPIWDKNKKLIAVVENLRDMTTQKNLEVELLQARDDALEAVRFKSEFLANMSHEIRTPMNGVLAMLQLVKDFDLPDECRDYIKTAHNSADALLEIINDILDFSKIEAGKLSIENVDFDLQEIVDDVCALLLQRTQDKNIDFLSYLDNKIPARIKGDPTRLRQILLNLLGNAIKFTEKGEVVIRLVNVFSDNSQATIKIEVVDTGIGIPEKVIDSLFEAFTQADGSTTRKFGGTGLGLTICKQLVELMGGKLEVESELGKGSNFFFTLSFDVVVQDRRNIEVKELEGLNALIIDDNSTNRVIVCNYLNAWGMTTEQTGDVNLAYQLLSDRAPKEKQFDLVLLDMQMPGMDGIEFSTKMQNHKRLTGIPRILLSSNGHISSDDWQAAGLKACLQKPFRRDHLRSTISSIINVIDAPLIEKKIAAEVIPFKHNDIKILLVEDNLVNQKVACGLLKKIDLIADIAGNGQIALDKIAKTKYDIVLMDCQMPVMSGYEATKAIRSNEKNTNKHLTIVAMTANAMEGDKEKCFAVGMDDYLPKPVKLDVLKEILDKWLKLNKENQLSEEKEMDKQSIIKSNGVILDETVLSTLKEIMEDEFVEVLRLYLDESVSLMSDIHAGFSQEPDELLRAVHTLKSSSLNVGAIRLGDITANMEALLKSGDINAAKMYLDDLQDSFTETHSMLSQYAQSNVSATAS